MSQQRNTSSRNTKSLSNTIAQKEKYNRTCDFGPYLTNIYTLNEANKLLLENKEGFSPEVMMSFGAISKKDFITPDVAKSIISTQKDYTFEEDDRKFWNKFKFVDKSFKVENDCLNNGSKFDCSKDINENRTLANALKSLVKFNKW